MKTLSRILIFTCLLVTHLAQGEEILPGSWNVDMALSLGNETPIPAKTTMICLQNIKELLNVAAACSVNTTSTSGNHVDMNISCSVNGLKMDGTGSLSISPTTVDGALNLTMQMDKDQPVQTRTTLHAVRIGECRKQP